MWMLESVSTERLLFLLIFLTDADMTEYIGRRTSRAGEEGGMAGLIRGSISTEEYFV